jgi:hypothetical protein
MTRSIWLLAMSSLLLLAACGEHKGGGHASSNSAKSFHVSSSAWAQPVANDAMSADEAKRLGGKAGIVSPRLADCGAHCTKMLGDETRAMSEQRRAEFTQSCREACEKQMAGKGPARQRAHNAAADWRSLYLMGMLMGQSVYCIGKFGDRSAEASALVKALDAAKKTPDALAADDRERRAGELAAELARTEEGRRERQARDELARANETQGPQSAAANAAREAVSRAHDAAQATPLGKRVAEAVAQAQAARAKANQHPAVAEASRAWEAHNEAWRTRVGAMPPAEQARLQQAMSDCFKAYAEEQMRGGAKR